MAQPLKDAAFKLQEMGKCFENFPALKTISREMRLKNPTHACKISANTLKCAELR